MIGYVVAGAALLIALWTRQRRRRVRPPTGPPSAPPVGSAAERWSFVGGPVRLVAEREIRERTRSRTFKIGTTIILIVVAAAVVIPAIRKGHRTRVTVGVVGPISAQLQLQLRAAGTAAAATVAAVVEPNQTAAEAALRAGAISLAVVTTDRIVIKRTPAPDDTSAKVVVARTLSAALGLANAVGSSGLSADVANRLAHPTPIPITGLLPAKPSNQTARLTAVYGLILMFVLLSQYGTWILLGVVEEKSSRVVEVLLSTLRPIQLLTGKVVGIGAVALAQGTLIVTVAIGLGAAVGSNLVHGTAPLEVASVLCWTVLGYAFYCWVYAAGGALAERQEHVQSVAFPLQLPILVGYIASISALGATSTPLFVRVLAFLPPTAPFAMTVMVAQGSATWWEFLGSVVLTLVAMIGVARVAATVYERAVLLTGRRVRVREVLHIGT